MTLGNAADSDLAHTFVSTIGLSMRQRVVLPALLLRAARSLLEHGASPDRSCRAYFVPGRIELFGKHTDYGGGPSLVCAVERGFIAIAAERDDDTVMVVDAKSGQRVAFDRSADAAAAAPGWARYAGAVIRRVARDFPATWQGADIAFVSNLPSAAGLSSSSALVVATFLALDSVQHISASEEYMRVIHSRAELAEYLAAVEAGAPFRGLHAHHSGVGTLSGSEDHTAILCAEAGCVVQYCYLPASREAAVHVPEDVIFVIAASGVVAEKSGAVMQHYNRLALQVRQLEELWQRYDGDTCTLREIVRASLGLERLRDIIAWHGGTNAEELTARLAQFSEETEQLIPQALDALGSSDYVAFEAAANRSQELAEQVLQNQVEETAWLAAHAAEHGALAAAAFGAGFGGSVWALAQRERSAAFMDAWRAAYLERFPQRAAGADFWFTEAALPASELSRAAARG